MENTLLKSGKNLPAFGMRDKIGYALGDFGCNMSISLISSFMIPFYTQYIGLTEGTWAVIILLLKIWDAINDPIMGSILDNVRIGESKFKPWINYGSYGLIFTGALFFMPIPNAAYWVKVAVCLGTYMLWDFCYTVVNVPYGALSSAMTVVPQQRQSLSTFRSIGAGVGGSISIMLPLLVYGDDNNLIGNRFIVIGSVMGIMALFSFKAMLRMTTERVETPPPEREKKVDYMKTIRGFFTNRPLFGLSLSAVASISLFSTSYSNQLVFQCYFQNTDLLAIISFIGLPISILGMLAVGPAVKRFGKKMSAGVPFLFSIAVLIIMLFIPFDPAKPSSPWLWVVFSALFQIGGGVFALTNWAMISDCIDYQYMKTGVREEGSVYAMYSLFRKIAQGFNASLVPVIMTKVGYIARLESLQNPGVPERIKTMAILLPLIGAAFIAFALLFVYNLGKKQIDEMNTALGYNNEVDINEVIENMND